MPIFPTTEIKIMALAKSVQGGLAAHPDAFPAPPVATETLAETLTALQAAMARVTAARAAAEEATAEKAAILERLVGQVKKELRYAEDAVDRDDTKLKLLGWAARRQRTARALPGQPLNLIAAAQGEGSVALAWLAPTTGGKVTGYTVRRRPKSDILWTPVASTYERSIALTGQSRGVDLEYSVVATNKSGEGMESNSVAVVL